MKIGCFILAIGIVGAEPLYAQTPLPDACPAALADAKELITAFVARSADKSVAIAGLQAEIVKLKADAEKSKSEPAKP